MSKATDERDRLRDMVKALTEHGPNDALRMEFTLRGDGQFHLVCTHSKGMEAEKLLAGLVAEHLFALGVRGNGQVQNIDDVPNDDEEGA